MSSSKTLKSGLALTLAGFAVLMAGCEQGNSDGNAGAAAGTANAEAAAAAAPDSSTDVPVADQPNVAVIAERLPYAEVDNQLVYGHFVFPADMVDPLPAILLMHESWGLNENIRSRADRLAGEGYIVLAIDLFAGSSTDDPERARQQMLRVVENPELARENIRHAYRFVSETAGAPRVGSLGWDFGGGWSLNAAMLFPDALDAAVIVYGQVTDDDDALLPVDVPILGLFAGKDRSVSADSVQRFEEALERLRKNHEIHVYPNADHSFADPASDAYDRNVADDAWQRTLEFLNLHLRISNSDSS